MVFYIRCRKYRHYTIHLSYRLNAHATIRVIALQLSQSFNLLLFTLELLFCFA